MSGGGSSIVTQVAGLTMHALAWPLPLSLPFSLPPSLPSPSPHGPPAVLVHGLGVSSRYMRPTGDRLAPVMRVLAPDLPGFGRSDAAGRVYSIAEHAAALVGWMDALALDRVLLVANSYGCQVVTAVAATDPARVAGLVLSSPTVQADRRSVPGEIVRLVRDIPHERAALVPLVVGDYLRAGVPRVWQTLRNAIDDRIEERVASISAPTLLVRGSRDPIVSTAWLDLLAARMPAARVATIAGAGHAVNFSAAPAFARLIEELRDPIAAE